LKPGSILLVRTGWIAAYRGSSAEAKGAMAPLHALRACGIEASSRLVGWLWEQPVAAGATDSPAALAGALAVHVRGALPVRAPALLALPLGEQFVLDELAADCARDGRYEFLLTSAPLHLEGGVASPPNALAIK